MDHFSRRVLGLAVFKGPPKSEAIRAFLGRTIAKVARPPKYLICDQGKQFCCHAFKNWCRYKGIRVRFGAVGQYASLALLERFILTLKLDLYFTWYNASRPHTGLAGRTPDEVYYKFPAVNRLPRFEPRPRWPRPSPCAAPQALVKGAAGVRLQVRITFVRGGKHLPVVSVERAA